jgi:hypothetical protein
MSAGDVRTICKPELKSSHCLKHGDFKSGEAAPMPKHHAFVLCRGGKPPCILSLALGWEWSVHGQAREENHFERLHYCGTLQQAAYNRPVLVLLRLMTSSQLTCRRGRTAWRLSPDRPIWLTAHFLLQNLCCQITGCFLDWLLGYLTTLFQMSML